MSFQISKKRKFVQDGVFKAELDEFLTRELAEDGYSGVEVHNSPRTIYLVAIFIGHSNRAMLNKIIIAWKTVAVRIYS